MYGLVVVAEIVEPDVEEVGELEEDVLRWTHLCSYPSLDRAFHTPSQPSFCRPKQGSNCIRTEWHSSQKGDLGSNATNHQLLTPATRAQVSQEFKVVELATLLPKAFWYVKQPAIVPGAVGCIEVVATGVGV